MIKAEIQHMRKMRTASQLQRTNLVNYYQQIKTAHPDKWITEPNYYTNYTSDIYRSIPVR